MSNFKKLWFWLVLLNLMLWLAVFSSTRPQGELSLVFCDVGQGDAALISKGNWQILVDGGPPNNKVLDCLQRHMPFWDRTIEMIVATHGEEDHVGGLIDVIESYSILYFVIDSSSVDSAIFRQFASLVKQSSGEVIQPQSGEIIKIGSIELAVLSPSGQVLGASTVVENPNERSIVFQLRFGQVSALLTGDISAQTEEQIDFLPADILKIPHHGSKYSSSDYLLKEASPKLAVISVGKNSFGHPTKEVLDKLKEKGIKVWRTDTQGELVLTTTGQNWAY
jgi:competence protein ComEC